MGGFNNTLTSLLYPYKVLDPYDADLGRAQVNRTGRTAYARTVRHNWDMCEETK